MTRAKKVRCANCGVDILKALASKAKKRRCRQCGCTDNDCRKCIKRTGKPCHWVAADLCSACVA